MSVEIEDAKPYLDALNSLYEDSTYSAQSYFEAAKRAEFWGKVIVFVPALISAFSGVVVALGWDKAWGVASATAGLVAATGSFLGAERKAPSYKESARKYTQLRQEARLAIRLAAEYSSKDDLKQDVRKLMDQYQNIVSRDEPTPNRAFSVASRRIKQGVTDTDTK